MGGLPLNEAVWNAMLKECDVNQDGMVRLPYLNIFIS